MTACQIHTDADSCPHKSVSGCGDYALDHANRDTVGGPIETARECDAAASDRTSSTCFSDPTMTRIRNAIIVTGEHHMRGSLVVEHQKFTDLAGGGSLHAELDWMDDFLLPGMVEVHTDNLEKHLMPRPKTAWPVIPAILAHDAQIAAAGITTVLDAIAVGDIDPESVRMQTLTTCVAGLHEAQQAGI